MNARASQSDTTSVAASVAPEDLRCGDFVGILSEVLEFPSFYWCDSVSSERDELVRVRYIPKHGGTPLKIKAICLPFVYVKSPGGQLQVIDVRQVQLVRLTRRYGKAVWKDLQQQRRHARRRMGSC